MTRHSASPDLGHRQQKRFGIWSVVNSTSNRTDRRVIFLAVFFDERAAVGKLARAQCSNYDHHIRHRAGHLQQLLLQFPGHTNTAANSERSTPYCELRLRWKMIGDAR